MNAIHDRRAMLLKLALGLLLLAGLPFAVTSAYATEDQTIACSATCAGGSCTGTGSCGCVNGDPVCTDQESEVEEDCLWIYDDGEYIYMWEDDCPDEMN